MPQYIAVAGNGYGCGKSTFASMLRCCINSDLNKTAVVHAIARPLKNALRWMFGESLKKDAVYPVANGMTGRQLMQSLGTEWGRKCICDTFWIDLALARAERSGADVMIFDDLRFLSELTRLRERGAYIVYIDGSPVRGEDDDRFGSEGNIKPGMCDSIIPNVRTLENLKKAAFSLAVNMRI